MRNRIAKKMLIYFCVLLLCFSAVIIFLFSSILRDRTDTIYKDVLREKAESIANTITNSSGGGKTDINQYTELINDLIPESVWTISKGTDSIETGHGHRKNRRRIEKTYDDIKLYDLPQDSGQVISEALAGRVSYTENFSNLLTSSSITVGVPVYNQNNREVIGAVLLHSPLSEMNAISEISINVLGVSLLISIMLSLIGSYVLAIMFAKPLLSMNTHSLELANGNYIFKNNVMENNEFGDLAKTLNMLTDRLYEASLESDKLDQLRQEFIANISHELRTPITVLRGSIEALNEGVITGTKKKKEYYEHMYKETIYLQDMVNSLLDLSRIQNPDFDFEMKNINLVDVLNDANRSIKQIAKSRNIEINTNFEEQYIDVYADYSRLKQLFMIILDNAVKFSSDGSKVDFIVNNSDAGVSIEITNFGTEIDRDMLPNIFDRFYRAKYENNKQGTGLGLPIAKQLCIRQGIDINVESHAAQVKFIMKFSNSKAL